MLLDGDEIMDICYKCGFNNVSYFGRVFKQIKGKNPSQFRRLFAKT
jgi:YesN/AraC family two-component response regulator